MAELNFRLFPIATSRGAALDNALNIIKKVRIGLLVGNDLAIIVDELSRGANIIAALLVGRVE